MAILPVVKPIDYPEVLDGQENGRLPTSLLWSTPGQAGGATVRLVEPAARGWRAMCSAAKTAGHILKVTSSADSYRTYEQQVATFVARYEPDPFPGYISTRWWPAHYDSQGRWVVAHLWYQKPDTASAAAPGYSNHGWALAVDIGEESDGDSGVESIDDATVNWLIANAHRFGFSAEIQSEKWHWRRYSGDVIEPAILAYEQGVNDMTPEQNNLLVETLRTVRAGIGTGAVEYDGRPYLPEHQPTWLVQQVTDLRAAVARIEAALAAGGGAPPVGEVTLSDASVAEVAEATADELHARTAE